VDSGLRAGHHQNYRIAAIRLTGEIRHAVIDG
jgi:hypothetical protein